MTSCRLFDDILSLVGTLDDTPGENTLRERFRAYLARPASTVGAVRDYVETCLRVPGPQYNRALQDLVNHTGHLIGFQVEFGRYKGVSGEVGYDGIWRSVDLALVAEVKTSDAYTINTTTLVGYIDQLIAAGRVHDWDHALGLYILGRSDSGITQLEHSIVGQKRSHQLRVATVDAILSLAELRQDGLLSVEEAVALLKPTTVRVDEIVGILTRVAAQMASEAPSAQAPPVTVVVQQPVAVPPIPKAQVITQPPAVIHPLYLLTAVSDDEDASAQDTIRRLLDNGWYVFGDRTPGRKDLKPGDHICFDESGVGVVAEAEVDSHAEKKTVPFVRHPERFPWAFKVKNVRYFFEQPVVIDASLRAKLDTFHGRDPERSWAWFVQATQRVTKHDFDLLTGHLMPVASGG